MAKSRRATQVDVARLAGVSQTTVSMVLNGTGMAQRRVSSDVRDRVLDAISVTGYAANPVAQRLAGGRTSIIGVYTYEPVFPHAAGDFYFPFLEGLESAAEHAAVDLLMFTSMSGKAGRSLSASGGVGRLRVADGCVLLGRHSYPEDLAELLQRDFPFSYVGRREAPGGAVPYAAAAYDVATQQLTEQLLGLGHRRVVLANEHSGHESADDRTRGYHRAMAEAGLPTMTFDDPDVQTAEFLDTVQGAGVTAVLTAPGLAAPLRRAVSERGLQVPGDLSIVRLGDPEDHHGHDVEWTGFLIPRREMGACSLDIVLRQLVPEQDGAGDLQVSIPCTLVPGSTVGPFRPESNRKA